ncbi:MAG: hypothetical protein ACM4D3_19295 [Candidatus Sericytochromatia bacterium]
MNVASHVRVQATIAGLVNAVVNPAIDWLSSRARRPAPVWAADGLVVNFVITSLILSVLVALFAGLGVRRELRAGHLTRPLVHGLLSGVAASVLVVVVFWALNAIGVRTMSLGWLMAVKALYCGALGFLVARWVILRQLGSPKPNYRS